MGLEKRFSGEHVPRQKSPEAISLSDTFFGISGPLVTHSNAKPSRQESAAGPPDVTFANCRRENLTA